MKSLPHQCLVLAEAGQRLVMMGGLWVKAEETRCFVESGNGVPNASGNSHGK
ncbi:hypothetical protein [Vibrio navarrensis]|uniref:hypothetical protein n=1 Tax=Vibrio navarrensis TaxID=29495 RepID=UPI00192F20A9|nr:hypothetical protein [Vibrio navarrensis]